MADHDHAANKPRALLCLQCNLGLGYVERGGPEWLEAVLAYIVMWR